MTPTPEFIRQLAERTGESEKFVEDFLLAFKHQVEDLLAKGEEVRLSGFLRIYPRFSKPHPNQVPLNPPEYPNGRWKVSVKADREFAHQVHLRLSLLEADASSAMTEGLRPEELVENN